MEISFIFQLPIYYTQNRKNNTTLYLLLFRLNNSWILGLTYFIISFAPFLFPVTMDCSIALLFCGQCQPDLRYEYDSGPVNCSNNLFLHSPAVYIKILSQYL